MATIRLIPSSYTGSSTYLSASNASNMYNNTDNTTCATITNSSSSRTSYFYINGFNFSDIPSNATINSFTVKIKCYESGLSTSTSYLMYLVNGTTTTSDYASTMPSTSAQTITFDNVSSTWDTISGYGSSFGIRVTVKNESKSSTGILYVYGAEILVDYTLTSCTVTTTATNCTMLSDNPATVSPGESHTLWFNPTDSSYDLLTMTVGGNDVEPTLGKYTTYTIGTTSTTTYKVSTNYSTYLTYYLANAYDGDESTYFWSSEAQATGKYILITFDSAIYLNSFSTYSTSSTDYPKTCNVLQVSSDGSTWEDVGTFQASTTSTFSSINKTCKYVRIYATSSISNWLVLNEITMGYYDITENSVDAYYYTISSVDSDIAVVIEYGEASQKLYLKTGDSVWKRVKKIYRKVKNTKSLTTWEEVPFDEFNTYATDKKFQRLEIPSLPVGSVSNSSNAINLTEDSLANDTYTLYYEDADDKKLDNWSAIGTITKS